MQRATRCRWNIWLGLTCFDFELIADEPEIGAGLRHPIGVGARLYKAAVIEDDYLVGFAHVAEPMRDGDYGAAGRKFA
ncbi:MAG: hypothetical protein ABIR38_05965 [Chthoniobacterales bacterium]